MAKRNDSLPPPSNPIGLRVMISTSTRDRLMEIAFRHGYSMSAILRLLAEDLAANPEKALERIPKKPRKKRD